MPEMQGQFSIQKFVNKFTIIMDQMSSKKAIKIEAKGRKDHYQLVNIVLVVLANAIKQEKAMYKYRKEEENLQVGLYENIVYTDQK